MAYFGSDWEEKKMNQYFMYGTVVLYQSYLDMRTLYVVEDVFKSNSEMQGIFTGRDAEFMIIGKVLETIEDSDSNAHVVPELNDAEELIIRGIIKQKYGVKGEFHYYFIRK